ncbi:MAG: hypothetical protein P4L75_00550 [Clostridia bacterium]|nr:hypothetical protein [Clostridia bacterium]
MTRENFNLKWHNYWYYYKWHTIAGIFVLLLIITFVTQCANQVKPDVSILLVTKAEYVSQDQQNAIQEKLQQFIPDINKDGKKVVSITNIDLNEKQDATYFAAMVEKLMAIMQDNSQGVFIVDDGGYDYLQKSDVFEKFSAVLPEAATTKDGYEIAISGLTSFKNQSFSSLTNNLYFAVRAYSGKSKSPDKTAYDNAISMLKKIVENKPVK